MVRRSPTRRHSVHLLTRMSLRWLVCWHVALVWVMLLGCGSSPQTDPQKASTIELPPDRKDLTVDWNAWTISDDPPRIRLGQRLSVADLTYTPQAVYRTVHAGRPLFVLVAELENTSQDDPFAPQHCHVSLEDDQGQEYLELTVVDPRTLGQPNLLGGLDVGETAQDSILCESFVVTGPESATSGATSYGPPEANTKQPDRLLPVGEENGDKHTDASNLKSSHANSGNLVSGTPGSSSVEFAQGVYQWTVTVNPDRDQAREPDAQEADAKAFRRLPIEIVFTGDEVQSLPK